jgi:DNA-binding LacI/PurR family transcriptional regulator
VPLSTIDVSSSALGEFAGNMALKLAAEKRSSPARTIVVPPKLIVRDSTSLKKSRARQSA